MLRVKKITTSLMCVTLILGLIGLTGCSNGMRDSKGNKYGRYIGLEYMDDKVDVSEEDVEEQLNAMLKQLATYEELKTGKVKNGDIISIDYTGKIGGKKVDECSEKDVLIEVGDYDKFEQFNTAVVNKKPGSKVVTTFKLDTDFSSKNEDINGKECTFTIKINYIRGEEQIPEMTDAFVKEQTDGQYKTADSYREALKKELQIQVDEDNNYKIEKQLLNNIRANSEFKQVDEKLLTKYEKEYKSYYEDLAKNNGLEFNTYLSYIGLTEDEFEEEKKAQAKIAAKEEMIIDFISLKEKQGLTDEEYEEYVKGLKDKYNYTDVDTLKEDIEEYELEESIRFSALKQKVINFIKEKGKKVEKLSVDYTTVDDNDHVVNEDEEDMHEDNSEEKEVTSGSAVAVTAGAVSSE